VGETMPLQFLSASGQDMQFLDIEADVQAPIAASELEPNHRYAVLLFLQNNDAVEYKSITVTAWHDTFEVGVRGLSSLIIQSQPVDIPAKQNDVPVVVVVRFVFMSPSAGRGRLAAKILPGGPSIVQKVRIAPRPVAPSYTHETYGQAAGAPD
jgi:hypothetical protein